MGIDTMSIDGSRNLYTLQSHIAIAEADGITIENVGPIDRLPNYENEPLMKPVSTCLFVHLRIAKGAGAPVAIFVHTEGFIDDKYELTSSSNGIFFLMANTNKESLSWFLIMLLVKLV